MDIEKDPLFVGVATPILVGLFAALGVKIKREYDRIRKFLKRVWQAIMGKGITFEEHDAAIADLKNFVTELVNDRTYPIQPDSNGGKSMNDRFDRLELSIQNGFNQVRQQNIDTHAVASEAMGAINTHLKMQH